MLGIGLARCIFGSLDAENPLFASEYVQCEIRCDQCRVQSGIKSFLLKCQSTKLPLVIPNYSILKYSITRVFFIKDPGYPGDSNSYKMSTQGKFFYTVINYCYHFGQCVICLTHLSLNLG
jgi:hypothetical protein